MPPTLIRLRPVSYTHLNAILIGQGKSQSERLVLLHELALGQLRTLEGMRPGALPGSGGGESEKD